MKVSQDMTENSPHYPFLRAWQIFLIVIYGASGLWLGFANDLLTCPPLVLFWPASIFILAFYSGSFARAFFYGWLTSFSGGCAALYWLCLPVHNVGGLFWPLAILCAILISACLALQGGFFAAFCMYVKMLPPFITIITACLAWFLFEYLFALVLGFPWLSISGALAAWPFMIQTADIWGAWLASALWIAPLISLFYFFYFRQKKFLYLSAGITLLFSSYGVYSLLPEAKPQGESFEAIFIEGNIDQNRKWLPAFQKWTLDLYVDLTNQALVMAQKKGMEQPLVIWPETAMPFFFDKNDILAKQLKSDVKNFSAPLLFGAPGLSEMAVANRVTDEVYNRAFLLGPEGNLLGYYDKEHLVPFGEYLPEWLNLDFLEELLQGVGIYRQGEDSSPLRYKNLSMGMLICYEGIFPWLASERVAAGANVLVDISNDGWFGRSPASKQHLYLTVARSIEQNRWLLRATNTGFSAVIDNRGRIVQEGRQFERGYMLVRGRTLAKASIYSKIAFWIPCLVFLLTVLLIISVKMRKQSEEMKHKKLIYH